MRGGRSCRQGIVPLGAGLRSAPADPFFLKRSFQTPNSQLGSVGRSDGDGDSVRWQNVSPESAASLCDYKVLVKAT